MLEADDPKRADLALAGTRLGLWDWDMITGQTVFDERWAEIIGYSLDELQPTTIDTWVRFSHPEDLELSNAAIAAHIAGDADFYDAKVRMRHRDGHWVWVHDRGRIVERTADGAPARMLGTHEDITERVERDAALREAKAVFDNSLEGIVVLDSKENITSINPAFTEITGWQPEDLLGTSFSDIRTHAEDEAETERLRELARGEHGLRIQRDFRRTDGSYVPMLMSINRVLGPRGALRGFVVQLADIQDRVRAEQDRIDRVLRFDQRTGLPNRLGFLSLLDEGIESLHSRHRSGELLLLSIDQFDHVVDAFGHEAGEMVAIVIADRLRAGLRPADPLARLAVDQFGILLLDTASTADALSTASDLAASCAQVCQIPGIGEVFVTASIGAVPLPHGANSAEHALQRAAIALHAGEATGAGSIQEHREGLIADKREEVVRTAQIRQAWDDHEFTLRYQPIYSMSTGDLVSAEALMRWHSPALGHVPPDRFIPQAEDTGLIVEFGAWAIREVARQGTEWLAQGLDLSLAVNVSAQQLLAKNFFDTVRDALAEFGFPADHLILELTETTLLNASGHVIELLARLGEAGIRIAIDDFGTGYSSFAYLHQYPVNKLKIDKMFIDDIESKAGARSIVAAIIDLGHHLNMRVLAEGVETPEQLEILRGLGCDLYQGFVSSPAVPPEDLLLLAQR